MDTDQTESLSTITALSIKSSIKRECVNSTELKSITHVLHVLRNCVWTVCNLLCVANKVLLTTTTPVQLADGIWFSHVVAVNYVKWSLIGAN